MILSWDQPKKINTGYGASRISRADHKKWKAKFVGKKSVGEKRVEIRKTIRMTQILLVVTKATVTMSMNGKAVFAGEEMDELYQAVQEARKILAEQRKMLGEQ